MTVPLWPSVDPCGCPVGEGHRCPPPWVDDWPEPVAADQETGLDQVESGGERAAPGPGASTPGITEGLTPNPLSEPGEGALAPMLVDTEAAPPEIGGS